MAKLYLEIITPESSLIEEEVEIVEASGTLGEFGVLPGHIQFFTTLEPGQIRYVKGGKTELITAQEGFAEVLNDKITLVLRSAELPKDKD
jgi:F-type H+-transporting ATPase subunit epsilon